MGRTLVWLAIAAQSLAAQEPVPPDTTRRPQQLPAVQSVAPRKEREAFETKPNVGFVTLTGKELAAAPRFFGESDILRAVRLLPGVNARNDFSVGMNVRGGESDQNLVLLDGFPIYNPFHMGGLFGAFVEPMVDRVDFFTGGFPARYGGRLSSVLDVHSAIEPRSGLHGQVDMSFVATTLKLGSGLRGGAARGGSRRVARTPTGSWISSRRAGCRTISATRRDATRGCFPATSGSASRCTATWTTSSARAPSRATTSR